MVRITDRDTFVDNDRLTRAGDPKRVDLVSMSATNEPCWLMPCRGACGCACVRMRRDGTSAGVRGHAGLLMVSPGQRDGCLVNGSSANHYTDLFPSAISNVCDVVPAASTPTPDADYPEIDATAGDLREARRAPRSDFRSVERVASAQVWPRPELPTQLEPALAARQGDGRGQPPRSASGEPTWRPQKAEFLLSRKPCRSHKSSGGCRTSAAAALTGGVGVG